MVNPLSSSNIINEAQKYIAEGLNSSEISTLGIEVLCENSLDIEFKIRNNLQKQGICVMVMTPDISYIGHKDGDNCYGMDEIIVQIVENVPVNRASNKEKVSTALDIGIYVNDYMTSPNSPFGFGTFNSLGVTQGEDSGLLVVQSKFKAYVAK